MLMKARAAGGLRRRERETCSVPAVARGMEESKEGAHQRRVLSSNGGHRSRAEGLPAKGAAAAKGRGVMQWTGLCAWGG